MGRKHRKKRRTRGPSPSDRRSLLSDRQKGEEGGADAKQQEGHLPIEARRRLVLVHHALTPASPMLALMHTRCRRGPLVFVGALERSPAARHHHLPPVYRMPRFGATWTRGTTGRWIPCRMSTTQGSRPSPGQLPGAGLSENTRPPRNGYALERERPFPPPPMQQYHPAGSRAAPGGGGEADRPAGQGKWTDSVCGSAASVCAALHEVVCRRPGSGG